MLEVLPQERVQRRIVEQIVDPVPVVPMLFMVAPQMVEQLVDMLSPLDFRVAEQVIDVPKIVCPPRVARAVLRAPQLAEELMEVPTPITYSSLMLRLVQARREGIPVPQLAEQRVQVPWVPPASVLRAPVPQTENQLVEAPQFRSFVCNGQVWARISGPTPSGTSRRDTPPAQGGIEILGRDDCGRPFDHAARVPAVQVVRVAAIQFSRQSAGHSSYATVQFLKKVVDAVVHDSCPWSRQCSCVHKKRSSTSLFSRSEQEVPQIQSSTELNDDLER